MAELLVSGYYGDNNAGDEAILAGMIQAIRELDPEVCFTVISKKAAQTRAIHGVNAISRNDFEGTWRAMGRADLVISGGGSLLQDVTSTKSLFYYLGIISMAKVRQKPVMIYAQGVGPVNRPVGRLFVPVVVNRTELITVRDQESAETLDSLGVRRPPVTVTADAALVLGPSDPERGEALFKEAGADTRKPLIGVSVRNWKRGGSHWEAALAQVLDRLVRETGAEVLFIPLQQPHDIGAAAGITALMQERAVMVRGEFTHKQIQAMIARCQLLIGMRYHALVFAAMNAVPLVGLSYDPKTDSLLRLLGEPVAGRTDCLDPAAMLEACRRALGEAPALRARLLHKVAELTPLARQNALLALQLLQPEGGRP